jgi:hypothetical protein
MGSDLEPRRSNLPAGLRAASSPAVPVVAGGLAFVVFAVLVNAIVGLVAALVVGGLVFAGVRTVRQQLQAGRPAARKLSAADEQRAMHGDVRKLAPGDVVNYELVDWIVERTMTFTEDGFSWDEHMLLDTDSGRKLWLSVEDDDGLEVAVYERLAGVEYDPAEKTITHAAVTYTRYERGRARFSTRDESGEVDSGQMEYADYSADRQVLGLERYSSTGSFEVSVGTVISEHELDIFAKGSR